MSECTDCATARVRTWAGYRKGCPGCAARMCARSLAAFNALHPKGTGEREPLRELVQRLMPSVAYADARRMVWDWWQIDHPTGDRA